MRAAAPRALGAPHAVARVLPVVEFALVVVAWGALFGPAPLHAQSPLSTRVDTTLVTVGDRLSLEVAVEHPTDAVVSWPDSLDLGAFEVLEARVSPVRSRDGVSLSAATYVVTAFELGELELPTFEVVVLHPDGREEVLETDAYGVEVISVGVDESGDIREIRGPLAIPVGLMRLVSLIALLILVGAAAYALIRRRRSDDQTAEARPAPPARPAHEVALEELERLESSRLLAEGKVKEFHIRVSEIIRRYVEARFRVPALEMTTWEVLGGLHAAGVDSDLRDDLRRFLDQCDLVKFAKAKPGQEESRAVLELGRGLVRRSAPAPEPAPDPEPAPEPAPEPKPDPAPEPKPARDPDPRTVPESEPAKTGLCSDADPRAGAEG